MPKERRACLAEMKMNSYLEKHLDLTIKLSHVSFCSPLFEAGTRKCGNLFALLGPYYGGQPSRASLAVRQKVERCRPAPSKC